MAENTKQDANAKAGKSDNPAPTATNQAAGGADENTLKTVSAVGYLGILFLVPMLMFPKEKYAMFHANQGLLLLITAVAVNVIGGIIPIIGWFLIVPLGNLAILVFFILGLVNALGGKMQRLPLIGSFDILKVQE